LSGFFDTRGYAQRSAETSQLIDLGTENVQIQDVMCFWKKFERGPQNSPTLTPARFI
jgi:hypothetical protein